MFIKTITYRGIQIKKDEFGKWHIPSLKWGAGPGEWHTFRTLTKAEAFIDSQETVILDSMITAMDKVIKEYKDKEGTFNA